MFGTGPGALPSDAYMMGIDPVDQRRMMQESLEAILALFRAGPDERITRETDWFTLRDAQLHIRPYTWPYPEISTAAMVSPSGPRLAGQHGTSLLSLSMSVPGGFAALENTWQVVTEQAAKAGRETPDRSGWRVLGIFHLADTREQAIEDCTYGLQDFANYFGAAGFVPLSNTVEGEQQTPREFVAEYAAGGNCCIGTPDDAIELHHRPARAVRRLRHAAAVGTRLGRPRGDVPLLRAVRPESDAALQGSADRAAGVARVGEGHARPTARQRRAGHRERHHRAHRRDAGQELMRASVLRGGRMVLRDDVADPVPGPGQVLVAVKACGICGSDLHFAQHGPTVLELGAQMQGSPLGGASLDLAADVYMGHEFSAEVLEAGPDTDAPAPGTVVTSIPVLLSRTGVEPIVYSNTTIGGYAERMLLSAPLLLPVPNGLDPRHAALTEPMAVGLHAVNRSAIAPGDTALVLGCGPIGVAIIAALRHRGVEHIVGSDFSAKRRELAATVGAHETVDPAQESPFDTVAPAVVFEAVGAPGIINDVLRRAPARTRLVVAGVCMEPDTMLPFFAATKEIAIQFVFAYEPAEFAESLRAIAEGAIDVAPLITGEVPLDAVGAAFDDLAHPDQHCKILVTP